MKALALFALFLTASLAQAATPWETLVGRTLTNGTLTQTAIGQTKYLERRSGADTAYFTLALDAAGEYAKVYTAVLEHAEKKDGESLLDQRLYWFLSDGTLTVTAHYRLHLKPDGSLNSREEIAYGEEPGAEDLARWNTLLRDWAQSL